jgi:hypothetical protein
LLSIGLRKDCTKDVWIRYAWRSVAEYSVYKSTCTPPARNLEMSSSSSLKHRSDDMANRGRNEDCENDDWGVVDSREDEDDQDVDAPADGWNHWNYQQLSVSRHWEVTPYNFIYPVDVQRTNWDNSPQYPTLRAGFRDLPVLYREFQEGPWDDCRDHRIVSEEVQYYSTGPTTEQHFYPATISSPPIDPSILQTGYAAMTRTDDTSTTFQTVEHHRNSYQLPSPGRDDHMTDVFLESQSPESGNSPSDSTTSTESLRNK